MSVARPGNVRDYMNRSRQQLENIFTMPSVSIPTPILISRPRPRLQSDFHLTPYQDPDAYLNLLNLTWISLKKFKWQKQDQYQKMFGINVMTSSSTIFKKL